MKNETKFKVGDKVVANQSLVKAFHSGHLDIYQFPPGIVGIVVKIGTISFDLVTIRWKFRKGEYQNRYLGSHLDLYTAPSINSCIKELKELKQLMI